MKILTVNPGSTSTKIALFEDDRKLFSVNVSHDAAVLSQFTDQESQLPYRMETIRPSVAAFAAFCERRHSSGRPWPEHRECFCKRVRRSGFCREPPGR